MKHELRQQESGLDARLSAIASQVLPLAETVEKSGRLADYAFRIDRCGKVDAQRLLKSRASRRVIGKRKPQGNIGRRRAGQQLRVDAAPEIPTIGCWESVERGLQGGVTKQKERLDPPQGERPYLLAVLEWVATVEYRS